MPQINIPALPKIISRPRLERLLERAVGKRLTLVSGSPGQGKTALVAGVLQRLTVNVFWYTLNPANANPSAFIGGLVSFLQGFTTTPHTDADSICTGSVKDKCAAFAGFLDKIPLDNGLVVVLDDFNTIDENGEFGLFIRLLLSNAPSNFHFIIISRFAPRWNLAQKTVQREMFIIDDAKLAFSPGECHEFFSEIYHMNLSREQIERITALTEGWTPVMVMLGETLSEQFHPEFLNIEVAFLLNKIPVLSLYLEQELFSNLTPEQQNVLMATSVVREISSDLAVLLAGEAGTSVLKNLNAINMLVYPVVGKPGTFVLHSLWRSFLLQKAVEKWGRSKVNDLYRKAGDYFFSRNDWRTAIQNYVHAQDTERSIEVLRRSRPDVLNFELADHLHSLLIKYHPTKREYEPWKSLALACAIRYKDPALWHYYLQESLEGFRKNDDVVGELFALGERIYALMWVGDFRQMEEITHITEQSDHSKEREGLDLRINASEKIYASAAHCYMTGNLREAVRLGEEARNIGVILKDDTIRVWAGWVLAVANWFMGNFDVAQTRLSEAFERMNSAEQGDVASCVLPYKAGLIASFMGNFTAARSLLTDSLEKAQKLGMVAYEFYIKNYLCYAELYLGGFGSCEKLFNEMSDIIGRLMIGENDHIMSFYWIWRGHYMYVRGQYREAAALARQALKLRRKIGGEIYLIQSLLVLGGAMREMGGYHESENYLREALTRSIAAGSIFMEASCYLQLALLYDILGNTQMFQESIEGLTRLAIEKSYYHFFMWRDDHMARIISRVKESDEYAGYIRELSRCRFGFVDISHHRNAEKSVKIYVLGPMIVVANGNTHQNLRLNRPIYLLALLATQTVPVNTETIINEMWPDMGISAAKNNLYYTLNQLRKFLNDHDCVILKDGLCSLNTDKVWTDITEFKMLNKKAAGLVESNRVPEAINLLKETIGLDRGDLLEGANLGPLLSVEREAAAKTSYDSLVMLGRLLLQTGEYEEAVNVLSRATSKFFADEDSYRLLMLAHYALFCPAKALSVYNRLEKYLAEEFETSPHRKTKELRNLIRDGTDKQISELTKWLSQR